MRFTLTATAILMMALASSHLPAVETKQQRPLVSTQVYYANGILIASSKDGTAAVQWTKRNEDGSFDYEFRYRSNTVSDKELVGTGTVSPTPAKPATRPAIGGLFPGETQDVIVAGEVLLIWGKGNSDWGWIHYPPEDVAVQVVFANLKDLDLSRFRK